MQVAGYSKTRIHLTYVDLHEVTWCIVVWCTQNLRRDGSSFMWHQPCQRCKYTTSVDFQKRRAIKSYSLMRSLLESGEQRYIKAIIIIKKYKVHKLLQRHILGVPVLIRMWTKLTSLPPPPPPTTTFSPLVLTILYPRSKTSFLHRLSLICSSASEEI